MTRRTGVTAMLGALALAGVACAPAPRAPDIAALYAPRPDDAPRNPVVSIPGFLGSRLVDGETGVAIWGGADGLAPDPSDPLALRRAAAGRLAARPAVGARRGAP